jgi:hypothetical protein
MRCFNCNGRTAGKHGCIECGEPTCYMCWLANGPLCSDCKNAINVAEDAIRNAKAAEEDEIRILTTRAMDIEDGEY